jgi:hypothetical protein
VSLVYVCVTPSHLCFTLLCFASLSPLTQLQHPHATNCRRIEFRVGSFTLIPKTTAPHGTKVAVSIGGLTALIEIVCFIAPRCNASLFQHAWVCEGGFIRLIFSLNWYFTKKLKIVTLYLACVQSLSNLACVQSLSNLACVHLVTLGDRQLQKNPQQATRIVDMHVLSCYRTGSHLHRALATLISIHSSAVNMATCKYHTP